MYLSFNPVGTARGFQDAAWLVGLGFSAVQRGVKFGVCLIERFVRFQEAQKCDRDNQEALLAVFLFPHSGM